MHESISMQEIDPAKVIDATVNSLKSDMPGKQMSSNDKLKNSLDTKKETVHLIRSSPNPLEQNKANGLVL